mgnify:FL=1
MKIIYGFITFIFASCLGLSEMLRINSTEVSYPVVTADFFVFDEEDPFPVGNLSLEDFYVNDNGSVIDPQDLIISTQNPAQRVSLVITYDLSINDNVDPGSNFSKAIELGRQIIDDMPYDIAEVALTSFDIYSYLHSDFTEDSNALLQIINSLQSVNGSDPNIGLMNEFSGAINIAKRGQDKKALLLLTDGNIKVSADSLIDIANNNGISVYCVFMDEVISDDLARVSAETGGKIFRNSTEENDIESLAKSIISIIFDYVPYQITFESILNCDEIHNIELVNESFNISDSFSFIPEEWEKPYLENDPPFFGFSSVLPGESKTENIKITARNADITINTIEIDDPYFEIDSGNITSPVLLEKDESMTLRLKYSPQDSAIVFTSLNIGSDACQGNKVLITGGFPNTPPRERTLELVYPNGGETLIVGDTAWIKWQGLLPADVIQLEYSINGGTVWDTLALDKTKLEYPWVVPDILSDECLIRVIQLWPNNIGQTLDFRHEGTVTSANFNSDGNRIITSSMDTTARIWNSNTGVEIFRFEEHKLPVLWANFSPNDNLAVTASEDNTAMIWDVESGQHLHTLKGHTKDVRAANFSHDGRYIVTSGADGNVFVWDPQSGDLIDTVYRSTIPVWHSEFSHDNNYIIFSDVYGDIRIYDLVNDGTRILKTVNGVCPYVTISPDGTKIAATSWFGKCWVWDFATGDTLYTLVHPKDGGSGIKTIHSANFSSDSEILLTTAQDFNAIMWKADNGDYIATLKEHNASVLHGSFNFDDVRVLTASRDSSAKVWNLDKRDLQMDSSDSYFSISKAELQSYDIDFGKVPFDEVVDTLIQEYIINISNFDFDVDSIYITGEHASDFYMLDGFAPYVISENSNKGIEIRFNPTALGERRAQLIIDYPANQLVQNLRADVYDPGLELVTKSVDFGDVETGSYKDTLLPVVLRNRSTSDINISEVNNLSVDLDNFDILTGNDPVSLSPGETHEMNIRFTPYAVEDYVGMIEFVHDDLGNYPVKMYLYGNGVEPRIDSATIAIGSFSAYPGQVVDVPIILKNVSEDGIISSITGFHLDLYFNASLLEPLNIDDPLDIENGIRKLDLDLPLQLQQDSVLQYIQFKVGLGNDSSSVLDIENVYPLGIGKIVINTEDGEFNLLGICEEGGHRYFESDGRITLGQNKPNPFSDKTTIEFEIIENGRTSLYITDVLGNVVKTIFDDHLRPGIHSAEVDSKELNTGTYFYVLKTPTKHLVKRMTVNK